VFLQHRPATAPKTLPVASTPTPSAPLCSSVVDSISSMKKFTLPVLALPMRMPCFQPGSSFPHDSESATYMALQDENSARASELTPRVEVAAVPLRIKSDGVRRVEVARPRSAFPPRFEKFSIFGKLRDAVIAGPWAGVPFGYKNVAVRGHRDIGGLVE
jgi:hypothetical protein